MSDFGVPAAQAYSLRAEEYAELLGSMDATAEPDRALIGRWADTVRHELVSGRAPVQGRDGEGSARQDAGDPGRPSQAQASDEEAGPRLLLDVGCGPGHWTAWLDARLRGPASGVRDEAVRSGRAAVRVEGIDPSPAFVDLARGRFPGTAFRLGRAEDLGVPEASVHGILAWYSLIHTPPEAVPAALAEFARALAPGGSLLVGFFEGPRREPFDHAVTQAWYWPVPELAVLMEAVGFVVEETHTRQDPGVRAHGAILARPR
ncbi:class I SAM-dependent methyltransferase [Brevibacterium album]|uniref:class I SAM-dependent methyltransferase n=1 Tax=Brevibacterium album TaxID=417948 RepID=UPI00048ACA2A|nr:class I SAM-dependent methyltransferase [Brevibacterium album]